jgi:hypothetical protein
MNLMKLARFAAGEGRCHPRKHLPPVKPDELLGQVERVEVEMVGGVVAPLDRQLRKRDEERKLVGRYKAALGEEALDLEEELDLSLRIRLAHRGPGLR